MRNAYMFDVFDEGGHLLGTSAPCDGYATAFCEVMHLQRSDAPRAWTWEGFGTPGTQLFAIGALRYTVRMRPVEPVSDGLRWGVHVPGEGWLMASGAIKGGAGGRSFAVRWNDARAALAFLEVQGYQHDADKPRFALVALVDNGGT